MLWGAGGLCPASKSFEKNCKPRDVGFREVSNSGD